MSGREDFDVAGALTSLRTAVRDSVAAPAAAVLRERAERGQRARRLGTVGLTAVTVVAVLLAVGTVARRDLAAPQLPATTPTTPAVAPRPDRPVPTYPVFQVNDPIAAVDWANVTLTVPPRGPDCPSGQLRFSGGRTSGYPRMELVLEQPRPPAYGDLTRDGRPEVVIEALCEGDAEADHLHSQLLAVTRESSGALRALGWVGPRGWGVLYGFWFTGDRLVIEPEPAGDHTPGRTLEYRWADGRFESLNGGWPGIGVSGSLPGPPIDLGPADGHVARTLRCPGGTVRIGPPEPAETAGAGDIVYRFGQPLVPHVFDLAGDGHRYMLAAVICQNRSQITPPGDGSDPHNGQGVLVLDYDQTSGTFRAVDLMSIPADQVLTQWTFDRGRLTIGVARAADGMEAPSQNWRWNGSYFQRED
jgi:hypothetical protein